MCINRLMFLDKQIKLDDVDRIKLDDVDGDSSRPGSPTQAIGVYSPSMLKQTLSEARERLQDAKAQESQARESPAPTAIKDASILEALHVVSSSVLGADAISIPRENAKAVFNAKLDKVKEAFKNVDKDQSGNISKDELTWLLQKVSPGITRKEVRELFNAADTDKDGTVDWNEFVAFIFLGVNQRST